MKLLVLLALVSQAAVGAPDTLRTAPPTVSAAPTPCVETVDGSSDSAVTIDENNCKVWKVITNLTSLTVTSSSASEEVEDVDVTFSDAGGVSDFLAVGDGGNAKATTIAVAGSVNDVYVGQFGGEATDTTITLENGGGTIAVYDGATNTNIVNNGGDFVTIIVFGNPTGTTCNGFELGNVTNVNPCSCPGTC